MSKDYTLIWILLIAFLAPPAQADDLNLAGEELASASELSRVREAEERIEQEIDRHCERLLVALTEVPVARQNARLAAGPAALPAAPDH